ncbi:MAG: NAD(P)H nitroreductase [Gammaproteobacteria bacterium]|nr:NAD(P)H nitroreductase [Gammaproteobacteria bacterium]
MDVVEFLLNRHSSSKLAAPGPSEQQIDKLLQIALGAPDHGGLQPWHFIVMTGNGRNKFGDLLADAATANDVAPALIENARKAPLRAPVVIAVVAKYTEHDKVPWVEQVGSAACALFSMQQAALAMGFGGIWRTGYFATHDVVRQGLDLADQDEIVGFLYLGTDQCETHPHKTVEVADKVSYWR